MGAVFLNYRRGDSEGQARALFVELTRLLGKDSVFMDVDSIALGRDFRTILQERLGSCDVMVSLIGPDWLDAADPAGNRRLESPTDFVRQEIAAALKRNIPVIPVLVQGARMPESERLPDDLRDLPYTNGFELGHSTWESDVAEMVKRLGLQEQRPGCFRAATGQSGGHLPKDRQSLRAWLLRAAVVAAVIGAAGAAHLFLSSTISNPGTRRCRSHPPAAKHHPPAWFRHNLRRPRRHLQRRLQRRLQLLGSPRVPSSSTGPAATAGTFFAESSWSRINAVPRHRHSASGTYTIKGRNAQVFAPFQVAIKSRVRQPESRKAEPSISIGPAVTAGTFFAARGAGHPINAAPSNRHSRQALTPSKGRNAPVFAPFQVNLKNGASTGGRTGRSLRLQLAWRMNYWDIFRRAELVTYQCGAKQQALGAGAYTIKGRKRAGVRSPSR